VENVHTMDELRLTGNSMKGSRPILSFDTNFDTLAHLKILKCLFMDVFGTPRGHPKSKPFADRVMGFYYADGKVCYK
jgi:ribosome biogenesis protein BRX1